MPILKIYEVVDVSTVTSAEFDGDGDANGYKITGARVLGADFPITFINPAEDMVFEIEWTARVTLGTWSVTVNGVALDDDMVNRDSRIICTYTGGAWKVWGGIDFTEAPFGVTGTNTNTLTAGPITISLDPLKDEQEQIFIGAPTLTGNLVVQGSGSPKDGDVFYCFWGATVTKGVHSINIFNQSISASLALSGTFYVRAVYDSTLGDWRSIIILESTATVINFSNTRAQVQTLITAGTLIPGALYNITDCCSAVAYAGVDMNIYVKAISTTQLSNLTSLLFYSLSYSPFLLLKGLLPY